MGDVPHCHVWISRTELRPLHGLPAEELAYYGRWQLVPGERDSARKFLRRVLVDLGRDPDQYVLEAALEDWSQGAPFLRLRPRTPHLPILGLYVQGQDSRGCAVLEVIWETDRPWEIPEFLLVGKALWQRDREKMLKHLKMVEDSWCKDLLPESCAHLKGYWQAVTRSYVPEMFSYEVRERAGYCVVTMWSTELREGPLRSAKGVLIVLDGGPLGDAVYVRKDAAGHCSPDIMEEAGAAAGDATPGSK